MYIYIYVYMCIMILYIHVYWYKYCPLGNYSKLRLNLRSNQFLGGHNDLPSWQGPCANCKWTASMSLPDSILAQFVHLRPKKNAPWKHRKKTSKKPWNTSISFIFDVENRFVCVLVLWSLSVCVGGLNDFLGATFLPWQTTKVCKINLNKYQS